MSHEEPPAARVAVMGTEAVPPPTSLRLPAASYEVAQFVALRAAACVGADYSNLALYDADQQSLRLFHGSFLDPQIASRYTDIALSAPYPIAAAARSGGAVLIPNLDACRAEFPEIVADTVAANVQATASLPLHRADGSLAGAIGFAWSEPVTFDTKLQSALDAVAYLCTATLDRAERYDNDHQLMDALQRSLLGALPTMGGIETSARYVTASHTGSVGGDWYEGLLLDDGQIAVVVGDVTGHGVAAAADMALIRGMITALLHSGVPVADVFSEVSGVLRQRPGLLLASAALAVVDIGASTVTYATAGHPPLLLRLPDGRVRTLDAAHGPIIGIPRSRRVADTVDFPLGAQLVMFTDGLVERRDRPFDVGVDEIVTLLADLPYALKSDELVDTILQALGGNDDAEDDIAILIVEHVG